MIRVDWLLFFVIEYLYKTHTNDDAFASNVLVNDFFDDFGDFVR